MINFHNEDPSLEEVNLRKLIKEIQTPFYIYSYKTIKETYNEISKILNCEIFYSVKANSNQSIIALLSSPTDTTSAPAPNLAINFIIV